MRWLWAEGLLANGEIEALRRDTLSWCSAINGRGSALAQKTSSNISTKVVSYRKKGEYEPNKQMQRRGETWKASLTRQD
jgi:hypothetical protein